ncbi:MAG: FAD synthetase, partial [Rikenellaceae bacterium]
FEDLPPLRTPICTMGSFDGVHRGHQTLLSRCCDYSQQGAGESVVLTFEPHPRIVLGHGEGLRLLTTLTEKRYILEDIGIDNLIVIPFSEEFSRLCHSDFIEEYLLNRVNTHTLLMGYNHSFGRKDNQHNKPPLEDLKERYNFNVERLKEWQHNHHKIKVSSTTIRNLIAQGEVREACELLGRGYLVVATLAGDNIYTAPTLKLLPPQGRYEAIIDSRREVVTVTQRGEIVLNNPMGEEVKVEILNSF